MKTKIVQQLGGTDVLLPSLIEEGLAANGRVKARLSVLQAAGRHARDPGKTTFDLSPECRAAGLDPMVMEALVHQASQLDGERLSAPGLGALWRVIFEDVETMARSVAAGDEVAGRSALDRRRAERGVLPRHRASVAVRRVLSAPMTVGTATAKSAVHEGHVYYFCSQRLPRKIRSGTRFVPESDACGIT